MSCILAQYKQNS